MRLLRRAEFPCWLFRSVLLQGFAFLTTGHICFYAYLQKKEVSLSLPGARGMHADRLTGLGCAIWRIVRSRVEDEAVLQTLVRLEGRRLELVSIFDGECVICDRASTKLT